MFAQNALITKQVFHVPHYIKSARFCICGLLWALHKRYFFIFITLFILTKQQQLMKKKKTYSDTLTIPSWSFLPTNSLSTFINFESSTYKEYIRASMYVGIKEKETIMFQNPGMQIWTA